MILSDDTKQLWKDQWIFVNISCKRKKHVRIIICLEKGQKTPIEFMELIQRKSFWSEFWTIWRLMWTYKFVWQTKILTNSLKKLGFHQFMLRKLSRKMLKKLLIVNDVILRSVKVDATSLQRHSMTCLTQPWTKMRHWKTPTKQYRWGKSLRNQLWSRWNEQLILLCETSIILGWIRLGRDISTSECNVLMLRDVISFTLIWWVERRESMEKVLGSF